MENLGTTLLRCEVDQRLIVIAAGYMALYKLNRCSAGPLASSGDLGPGMSIDLLRRPLNDSPAHRLRKAGIGSQANLRETS